MSVNIEDFETPEHPDFQRANGAPMVMDKDGKRIRLSRPSNYAKPLDDESALTNWRIDTACMGVATHAELQAQYVALKPDDRETKKVLREKATQAGRGSQAADIGTALHSMSERWEQEPNFDPPSPYKESLQAYENEMKRLGLVSQLFEYHVVNLQYRSAGTADRLYETTKPLITPDGEVLPEGSLIVGDLKTGKRLDYSLAAYAVQMTLYASGEMYDVATDTYLTTPDVNQRWGIIMWMPADQSICEALWVDLTAGNYGAWLASEIKDWRRKWRSGEYASPKILDPHMSAESIAEELGAEIVGQSEADAEWLSRMAPFAQYRIEAIKDDDKAKAMLLRDWPEGLPTPKKGVETVEQMTTILDLLDLVEKQHSLQFPSDDPRVKTGVHKDAAKVTNNPPSKEDES